MEVPLLRFQLHHTGIKTQALLRDEDHLAEFQLHHTGIKTTERGFSLLSMTPFQLHHTGIKTCEVGPPADGHCHFNCTIQELKQHQVAEK